MIAGGCGVVADPGGPAPTRFREAANAPRPGVASPYGLAIDLDLGRLADTHFTRWRDQLSGIASSRAPRRSRPSRFPADRNSRAAVESPRANQHHRLDRLSAARRLVSLFCTGRSCRSSTSPEVLFPSAHAAALRYPGQPRLRTIPLRRSPFHDPRPADAS